MNKELFQEWARHPVTKHFLEHAENAQERLHEESCIRDTVDQTAMQVARNEGFCEGVDAIGEFIEDKMLEYPDED